MTYSDRATRYARRVVEGELPAARPTRLACERHLLDLEKQSDDEFPYRFDHEAGDKVCRFLEALPHVKGKWGKRGDTFDLEDWQCFIVCSVFGWLRKADDLRRFRRVYIEVARKNGKSQMTAGVGLYMFAGDGEFSAEVYSGAGSEKQAWEVFGPARQMAKRTPGLCDALGIEVNAKNMNRLQDMSKFEPVIGKPGDGASPSMAIHDEYHEHATEDQYDTMLTGMGSRDEPLSWVITTAGDDTAGPCYALRSESMDVLEGSVQNDEMFALIYTIDEDTDWTSDEAIEMANPNVGVSVTREFIRQRVDEAVNSPRKQATTKTKHFCVWVTAGAPYFDRDKWDRLADPELDPSDFEGEPCWIGLDLASKKDLVAAVKLFRREVEGEDHYYAFGRFYIPRARAEDPDKRHYAGWVEQGHLIATPGNVTHYDRVEDDLKNDAERFRVVSIGADPYNIYPLANHLVDHGLEVVEISQTVAQLSEPMKWVDALILDGRLHHDGNPVFGWGIGNVTAQVDRNDNVFPRKERNREEKKIDPASALIDAMNRAMADKDERSVYEDRGIEVWA